MAARIGVKVNLVADVYSSMREIELKRGTSKTLLVTAGMAALRSASDADRDEWIQWATLIDEEKITWDEFAKFADQAQKERQKALVRLAQRVLSDEVASYREEQKGQKREGA